MDVLVIGGTRFLGRHAVEELLAHEYDVTLFNRGTRENPFAGHPRASHVAGDRTVDADLEAAAEAVDPEAVVDCFAYYPRDVRAATRIFADVERYVYVSSGAAYGRDEVPKREGETPLAPCSEAEATDDSWATYGARKAEGDRAVFAAADRGVPAVSVRPTIVYGPGDYTGRFDYWVKRVAECDSVLVPGDGTFVYHLVAVGNVARAIRAVTEEGRAGEAYNVGDPRLFTLGELVKRVAAAADTDVEVVTAGERELARGGIDPGDFPFYDDYPQVLETGKLSSLGWEPVDPAEAIERAVRATLDAGPEPAAGTPDRAAERRVLDDLVGA